MNKERLTILRDYLLNEVPPDKFSITNWVADCGTVACAIGHACNIPSFQKAGLHLEGKLDPGLSPAYNGNYSWRAVEKFFDLEAYQAAHLFDGEAYPKKYRTTLLEVVNRLAEYIRSE